VIRLLISIIILFILLSCQIKDSNKVNEIIIEEKVSINEIIKPKKINNNQNKKKIEIKIDNSTIKYVIGEPYYIDGVKYIPIEDYNYEEVGLANFYGKDFHNKKTANNDFNKVTELLGRHKTLPLPSIVKITNLENGLSLTIKINDRHLDNSSLIQVSRKTAQILKFYKKKIARVKVQILSDPSKQWKVVTQSMNEPAYTETIDSAPTEEVSISNLDDNLYILENDTNSIYQPIELGFEDIAEKNLYLKIYGFGSYKDIRDSISDLELTHKFITQKDKSTYSVIFGPLENLEANNLVLSFISKGYKKTEIILE